MPDRTYKIVELVGSSEKGSDEAIRNALTRAGRTLKGLDWLEVKEIRGRIEDGGTLIFQVTIRVGFRIMDDAELQAS